MNIDPSRRSPRSRRVAQSVAAGLFLVAAGAVAITQTDAFGSTTPHVVGLTSPGTTAAVPLVPAQGALLGHYYGNGTIAQTDRRIGRKPAVHLTYYDFASDD